MVRTPGPPPWQLAFPLDADALAEVYDDLPVWSAPFGLALFETVRLHGVRDALDLGSGTGFPALELASRLGPDARVIALDPWESALSVVTSRARARGIDHLFALRGRAEALPFQDESFDLVVSNNGLNNVSDERAALAEAWRVSRPGAQLALTVNLPGTMREVYDPLTALLTARGDLDAPRRIEAQIASKRKPTEAWVSQVEGAGFRAVKATERAFSWRFADGTAMLHHWFIRLAFLPGWASVVPPEALDDVFTALRTLLDERARTEGGLSLTVPFICLDARR